MNRKIMILVGIFFSFILAGCGKNIVKNNVVYQVKEEKQEKDIKKIDERIETEGIVSFTEDVDENESDLNTQSKILISKSPKDKIKLYLSSNDVINNGMNNNVIKGEITGDYSLVVKNIEKNQSKILVESLPVISVVKWNKQRTVVAMCGGNRLTIYSAVENKLLLEKELANEKVKYFGWSPDGKKIYTEHPSLPNGSIIYVDSRKLVHAYETKENLYYKGILDDKYYYTTFLNEIDDVKEKNNPDAVKCKTVTIDKESNIIKEIIEGRFRDSYKRAILQVGEDGFRLNYIKDINDSENVIRLSSEYIYDAKFITGGKIAFITAAEEFEKNNFILNIVGADGKLQNKINISGSSFAVSPNRRRGYVSGYKQEIIDLNLNIILYYHKDDKENISEEDIEKNKIIDVLRQGLRVFYFYQFKGVKDEEKAEKYFIDTHNPEQSILFELKEVWKNNKSLELEKFLKSKIEAQIVKPIYIYTLNNKKAASVTVKGSILTSNEKYRSMSMTLVIELIQINDRWYITGASTFPFSKQYKKVKQECEKLIRKGIRGEIFEDKLNGKEVEIGQIQFWQMSEPHLASDAEYANYCKVFLKVKENNRWITYKMTLQKVTDNKWQLVYFDDEKLINLF